MRRRRILTAKRGFTAWAFAVYAFLYLPILVVVIFAFDAPSPTSVAAYKGSNICNIDVADIGNISVWNGFESCWFAKGLDTTLYTSAIKTSFFIAARGVDHRHRSSGSRRRSRWRGCGGAGARRSTSSCT